MTLDDAERESLTIQHKRERDATHLFEEPGCLEEVARLAKERFAKHLNRKGR